MTAASSTHQALIQTCTAAGKRARRTGLLTASTAPSAVAQRRASMPRGSRRRVRNYGVAAVVRVVKDPLIRGGSGSALGAGRQHHAGKAARFDLGDNGQGRREVG